METIDAIKTRRSVRGWSDKEVSEETMLAILDAGRFAPSPLNSQPWHFTVVRYKETIDQLVKKADHGSFLTTAKVVIVVTVSHEAKVDKWLSEHEQHIYSGVCAMENMWLAAWDAGIGACWVTLDEKTTRQLLYIPAEQKLLGSLALGHTDSVPKPHAEQDRKPLSEMVSYERFGEKIRE